MQPPGGLFFLLFFWRYATMALRTVRTLTQGGMPMSIRGPTNRGIDCGRIANEAGGLQLPDGGCLEPDGGCLDDGGKING